MENTATTLSYTDLSQQPKEVQQRGFQKVTENHPFGIQFELTFRAGVIAVTPGTTYIWDEIDEHELSPTEAVALAEAILDYNQLLPKPVQSKYVIRR